MWLILIDLRIINYTFILEIECSAKYILFLVIQKVSNIFYSISDTKLQNVL